MNRYVPVLQGHASDKRLELDSLVDSNGILTLRLSSADGSQVRVVFDSYLAYRKLDEGDALEMISWVSHSSILGKSFYEVHDSEFLAWYEEQSAGVRKSSNVRHFAVFTANDVIDVLALDQPDMFAE